MKDLMKSLYTINTCLQVLIEFYLVHYKNICFLHAMNHSKYQNLSASHYCSKKKKSYTYSLKVGGIIKESKRKTHRALKQTENLPPNLNTLLAQIRHFIYLA